MELAKTLVPVKQSTMKAIITAITFIEKNGGLRCQGLYQRESPSDKSHHCKQLMLQNDAFIQLEDFDEFDVHDVAEGVKYLLTICEPLVPLKMFDQVMNITDGSEIEILVASEDWDNIKAITFIALLHHLAKITRKQKFHKISSDDLGTVFGEIFLPEHDRNILKYQAQSKAKGRRIALIIRHIAAEIKGDTENTFLGLSSDTYPELKKPTYHDSTSNKASNTDNVAIQEKMHISENDRPPLKSGELDCDKHEKTHSDMKMNFYYSLQQNHAAVVQEALERLSKARAVLEAIDTKFAKLQPLA